MRAAQVHAPPLVIQRGHTLLVPTQHGDWPSVRDTLRSFADLVRLGNGVATYRLTNLSLWNAASRGETAAAINAALRDLSADVVPPATVGFVQETLARVNAVRVVSSGDDLRLVSDDAALLEMLIATSGLPLPPVQRDPGGVGWTVIAADARGAVKLAFAAQGYPIADETAIAPGAAVRFRFRADAPELRRYQRAAVESFARSSGGGLVLLPCGAGKTLIGVGVAARYQSRTLVLCPGRTAAHQWRRAFLAWTDLPPDAVGVFDGKQRALYPVTIATYQALTTRANAGGAPRHLGAFLAEDWGVVIYDEAHMLPANGFRLCAHAAMQSRRRLGLTATLVREDGREGDVFALVGPVVFNRPWRELEAEGWIAPARCIEVRVPLAPGWPGPGVAVDARVAALNPRKDAVVEMLLARHAGAATLVIGGNLDLLHRLARRLRAPLITGETVAIERERLFEAFRAGRERLLIVSSVANQGVDLPGASVAIQVSGHFGSRQEEAQRLGRILRPNAAGAQSLFYTLVSDGTAEVRYAQHRRLYLAEQGYTYCIERHGEAASNE